MGCSVFLFHAMHASAALLEDACTKYGEGLTIGLRAERARYWLPRLSLAYSNESMLIFLYGTLSVSKRR